MAEKFLVTGALGCIGAWTVKRLVAEGVPVWTYDLPGEPHRLRLIMDDAALARAWAGNSAEAQLYLLPADGARPPVQLPRGGSDFAFYMAVANSPDGRYLSYAPYGEANFAPLALLDLTTLQPGDTAAVIQTLTQQATAAAWAPSGHRLAVAGAGGLRIIDLDTGPTRWLDFRNCSIVEWYALPPG